MYTTEYLMKFRLVELFKLLRSVEEPIYLSRPYQVQYMQRCDYCNIVLLQQYNHLN